MKPVQIAPGNLQPCPGDMAAGIHFRENDATTKTRAAGAESRSPLDFKDKGE